MIAGGLGGVGASCTYTFDITKKRRIMEGQWEQDSVGWIAASPENFSHWSEVIQKCLADGKCKQVLEDTLQEVSKGAARPITVKMLVDLTDWAKTESAYYKPVPLPYPPGK